MQALRIALIVIEVIVLFNLLIIVHELGHFLAARWRGLVVEKFGIWFGKPLWKKTINGVQYSLGSIPFGGFVSVPQLAPMDIIEGKVETDRAQLPPISALDKIIVAVAGPLFSLLLALVFACIVWGVGHPVAESDTTTTIGYVAEEAPAFRAGLQAGDTILEVDGEPVKRFSGMNDSVVWNVVRSEGETIPFKVQRGGAVLDFQVAPFIAETRGWRRKSVRQVGLLPAQTAIVDQVVEGSAAAAAGLRPGDVVRGVNGTPVFHPAAVGEQVNRNPGQPVTLTIERAGQTIEQTVQPAALEGQEGVRIGVWWDRDGRMAVDHPNPIEQVYKSITATLNTIGAVASPKSDVKLQHLSGPFGIARIYYLLFQSEHGWKLALWFSVILNVNLAILNMLPIPVLDGGHIVLAIIESIRRKPVNIRVLEAIQTACAILIIGYMAYVSFFDLGDWFGRDNEAPAPRSAPATPAPTP
ncbi:RIP metalloprotease RseP [soil metagenome]